MGVVVCSSHIASPAPSSSAGGLLTLCPCSGEVSLPQETVLHKLFHCESFPQAAALHELPQRGSFPWGSVLQEQAAPAYVPHGVTSPAGKPTPAWASLSPWVHRSWQEPAPEWASHGVTASFRHSPAPVWGPFHGLQVNICCTVDLHGLQGHSLPHHGVLHGLLGNPCYGAWSTSSPSFVPDLGVCRVVFLTLSQSSLLFASSPQVFPLLKYVITEGLPPLLIGFALASSGSILELTGIGPQGT